MAKLYVITGPAGVGKSTISRKIAEASYKSALIEGDDLYAQIVGGFENLIMVSPTHVPFEGTLKDKKTMTGHSIATWKGLDVPFVTADFSKVKAAKYQKHPDAKCKVTGIWVAYHDAYHDNDAVERAKLHVEKTGARVLLIAGDEDKERKSFIV